MMQEHNDGFGEFELWDVRIELVESSKPLMIEIAMIDPHTGLTIESGQFAAKKFYECISKFYNDNF